MGLNKRQRDYFWPKIIDRNGHDLCIRCGKLAYVIHHINGDDTDNRLENMDALCRGCNKLKKLQKKNLPVSTMSYQISAAHKKNLLAEPSFRRWLEGKLISNNDHYPLDFAIAEGALFCSVSTETVKRYLLKLCDHPTSPYVTQAGRFSGMEIYFKDKAPSDIDYS